MGKFGACPYPECAQMSRCAAGLYDAACHYGYDPKFVNELLDAAEQSPEETFASLAELLSYLAARAVQF